MKQTTWLSTQTQETVKLDSWSEMEMKDNDESDPARLSGLLTSFSPIDLQQMDSVALLNRYDQKFILTIGQLLQVLSALTEGNTDYRILTVNGQQLNHYRTLYFDTGNFALYHQHVNGRADRYKVRCREYLDSRQAFLEVKHRTPKDRTIKSRVSTGKPVLWLGSKGEAWLGGVLPFESQALEPKLWSNFSRITLVNMVHCERVTIDVDLSFYATSRSVRFENIAVVEVKQDKRVSPSPLLAEMQALRVHPQGFSKYCIGISLLYDHVKKNSLKDKFLWLERNSIGVYYE